MENIFNLTNLFLWFASIISGVGSIFFYFDFKRREKRLPHATKFADLEMQCTLKQGECDLLFLEVKNLENKKAEKEYCESAIKKGQELLDYNTKELQKIEADRREQEVIRQETLMLKDELKNFNESLGIAQRELAQVNEEKANLNSEIEKFEKEEQELLKNIEEAVNKNENNEKLKIDLDQQIEIKQTEFNFIEESIKKLTIEKNELDKTVERHQHLSKDIELFEKARLDLMDKVEKTDERHQGLLKIIQVAETERESKEQQNNILNEKIKDRISETNAFEESIKKLKTEKNELLDLVEKHKQLPLEIARLEDQRLDLKNKIEVLETSGLNLQKTRHELQGQISDLENEHSEKESKCKKIRIEHEELIKEHNAIKQEKAQTLADRNVLKHECDQYNKIKNDHQAKSDNKNALEDLTKPYFSKKNAGLINISEKDALERLKNNLDSANLKYSQRMLYSFHTSLKTNDVSPLVVLSGISGTGKSQLPQRYAAAMGIHYLNMAVQPRWDSPQDIFGFYNYLEEHYKSTELTRALIQAERHNQDNWPDNLKFPNDYNRIDDQMMMVLFDEMNLARVEYYFSEFLSKLEVRRGINPEKIEERRKAEIVLEIGKSSGKDMRLYVDNNVLFVGTMNEDESTQSLSDKILDRANVLRFGRPKKLGANKINPDLTSNQNVITFKNWNDWISDSDGLSVSSKEKFEEKIDKLNEAMEGMNRSFGHRTCQAILSYIANYPKTNNKDKDCDIAFADQIEQRIIPKLRNINCNEDKEHLKKICDLIEKTNDDDLYCSFKKAMEGEFFEWNGVERE